jgi:hypothetical protein
VHLIRTALLQIIYREIPTLFHRVRISCRPCGRLRGAIANLSRPPAPPEWSRLGGGGIAKVKIGSLLSASALGTLKFDEDSNPNIRYLDDIPRQQPAENTNKPGKQTINDPPTSGGVNWGWGEVGFIQPTQGNGCWNIISPLTCQWMNSDCKKMARK